MLLALFFVAGSAMAQTKTTPFRGSKYSYTLDGILVNSAGSATIAYSIPADVTIDNIVGATVTAGSAQQLTFDITYSATATLGAQSITVTIADGGGCTNFINCAVNVQAVPTIELALSVDAFGCQNLGVPINNQDAAHATGTAPATNDIVFTVTPDISAGASDYTYGYTISIPTDGQTLLTSYALAYSGPGTYTEGAGSATVSGISQASGETVGTFTVTFATTTGIAPVTISPVLSSTTLTLAVANGGGAYTGTYNPNTISETVPTTPTISGTIH